ncbi:hypothetical protein A4244_02870 [Bacillus badius]|nr:hypothetical protein A4244_02870 [Bacillus badius]OCS88226.1 hypothetical protein A6M11_02870 [Bacillus badius]OVE53245.1 hypothetical protein B1A98_00040 [Bacillus badius]
MIIAGKLSAHIAVKKEDTVHLALFASLVILLGSQMCKEPLPLRGPVLFRRSARRWKGNSSPFLTRNRLSDERRESFPIM